MATAQETLVATVNLDSTVSPPNAAGTIIYTVPAGRFSEVWVQYVQTNRANSSGGTVYIGNMAYPTPTADGVLNFGAHGVELGVGIVSEQRTINSHPIILFAGQTIRHSRLSFSASPSTITCMVKEFNVP